MSVREAGAADFTAILHLLAQARMPTADLTDRSAVQFWVAPSVGAVIGAVGLERHGDAGLLRSLVVAPDARGQGVGLALVEAVEVAARDQGINRLVLLTQTARAFFERRGYELIEREAAPDAVKASAQFRSICPASAVCMTKSSCGAGLACCSNDR